MWSANWPERRQIWISLIAPVLIGAAILGLREAGTFQSLEQMVLDRYMRIDRPTKTSDHVLIVTVTERDLRALGRYPISDGTLAAAIRTLRDRGAAVIGVDVYRNMEVPPGTAELARVLEESPRVLWIRLLGMGGQSSVPAPKVLRGTDRVGFSDVLQDADGVVRRALVSVDVDGEFVPSLGLQLALRYLEDRGVAPAPVAGEPDAIRLGPTVLRAIDARFGGYVGADTRGYQLLYDFRGATRGFDAVTLGELLSGGVAREQIRGRMVLIGLSAETANDFFQLPFLPDAGQTIATSGSMVIAHLADQLVRYGLGADHPISSLREGTETALTLGVLLLGWAAGLSLRGARSLLVAEVVGLSLIFAAGFASFLANVWTPVVPAALGFMGSSFSAMAYVSSHEKAQRELVMDLFSRHVSERVAREVWSKRQEFLDGGRPKSQRLQASVLFVDMKGYTTHAEKLDPEALMSWVNAFMAEMASIVKEHGGLVDDYFGDGLKASFGVPLARTSEAAVREDATAAVDCAREMGRAIVRLNHDWKARDLPQVSIRVGIASGAVVAGELGAADRLKYTTVGDVVVSAQRLESLDASDRLEAADCRILISEQTRTLIGPHVDTTYLGEFRVKGKTNPIAVYHVPAASSVVEVHPT